MKILVYSFRAFDEKEYLDELCDCDCDCDCDCCDDEECDCCCDCCDEEVVEVETEEVVEG